MKTKLLNLQLSNDFFTSEFFLTCPHDCIIRLEVHLPPCLLEHQVLSKKLSLHQYFDSNVTTKFVPSLDKSGLLHGSREHFSVIKQVFSLFSFYPNWWRARPYILSSSRMLHLFANFGRNWINDSGEDFYKLPFLSILLLSFLGEGMPLHFWTYFNPLSLRMLKTKFG